MRVLLVSCYELGHQPLGLASPAAHLLGCGIDVACLDLAVEAFRAEAFAGADVVAFSIPMHTALRLAVGTAGRARPLLPDAHFCFYGLYASLNGDYLLRDHADSVIGGEYEESLTALVSDLESGREPGAAGVRTRNRLASPFLGHQRFLTPARHLLPPLSRYARLEHGGESHLAGYTEASRGCAHRCRHCPITPVYEGALRIVPADIVAADVRALVALGARHITFGDPDFLNGVRHSLGVARTLHDEFPELTFDITTKIEHVLRHRDVFADLRRLGCLFVVSAVESLSDEVLAHLDKGHSRSDVAEALAVLRDAGIALRPSLVSFTPWTTIGDFLDVLDFVERHDLVDAVDPVHYTIRLLVPPGSSLLGTAQMTPHLGQLDEASLTWRWTHPDPRLDELQIEVSRLVEEATGAGEDNAMTFTRVREAALRALPEELTRVSRPSPSSRRAATPRLSEAWFC